MRYLFTSIAFIFTIVIKIDKYNNVSTNVANFDANIFIIFFIIYVMNTFTILYNHLRNNNIVTNLKDFANKSGYDYIYLSKMKNGKHDVSSIFIDKINSIFGTEFDFNEISERSGEYGQSDIETTIIRHSKGQPGILFYDLDFLGGNGVVFDGGDRRPDYVLDIPEFNGCTAFRIYGDSMEPRIKSGSMVFAKKIENWKEVIEYG